MDKILYAFAFKESFIAHITIFKKHLKEIPESRKLGNCTTQYWNLLAFHQQLWKSITPPALMKKSLK